MKNRLNRITSVYILGKGTTSCVGLLHRFVNQPNFKMFALCEKIHWFAHLTPCRGWNCAVSFLQAAPMRWSSTLEGHFRDNTVAFKGSRYHHVCCFWNSWDTRTRSSGRDKCGWQRKTADADPGWVFVKKPTLGRWSLIEKKLQAKNWVSEQTLANRNQFKKGCYSLSLET